MTLSESLLDAILAGDILARRALVDLATETGVALELGDRKPPRLPEITDSNWDEAFGYADGGEGHSCGGGRPELTRPGAPLADLAPFGPDDVAWLLACKEGENDSEDWLACGMLWDGRAFGLKAGCDFTGWG